MKRLLVCTSLLFVATPLFAQQKPLASPPAKAELTVAGKAITVTYSSPKVNGRGGAIFSKDGLIGKDPSYPIWRAGANAATVLHADADLTIGGVKVPAGNYSLWVDISDPDGWVLIVNKQSGQWGRTYDKAQDLGHVKMTMDKAPALVENLRYDLKDLGGGKVTLSLAWENRIASVPVTVQ
jgi:hypothetical protein